MDNKELMPPSHGDLDTREYVYISTTVLMFTTTLSVNLAIGCTLQPQDFKRQWNTLGGVLAGALLQYLIFPLTSYIINHIMGLPASYNIGIALVASCPGSALTNLVTYYINGDVCLSFSLTAVNSAVSVGLAPAMLNLFTRSWTHETLHIALWPLAFTLLLHVVTPSAGYLIKKTSVYFARYIEKIGTVIGLVSFIVDCVMQLVANRTLMVKTTWGVVFTILLLPCLSWVSAYTLALLFKQNVWKRRSICVEILLHNVSLAVVILGTTFHNFKYKREVGALLSLCSLVTGLYGLLVVTAYSLRAPWTKSGSEGLSRTQELHDLAANKNDAVSISDEDEDSDGRARPELEQKLGKDGNNLPIGVVRGPSQILSNPSHADIDTKSTPTLKPKMGGAVGGARMAPDPPLAIARGPITVSMV